MKSISVFLHPKETDILKITNNIKNIFKQKYGWNVDHVKLVICNKCRDEKGNIDNSRDHNECGGSYIPGTIFIGDLEHQKQVRRYYNMRMQDRKFLNLIIAHELAHEVYEKLLNKKDKEYYDEMLIQAGFTTPYLQKLKKITPVERFAEYIANSLFS